MVTDTHRTRGTVIDLLPNLEFRVDFGSNKIVRCYLAGKLKIARIQILIGDEVDCVVPPGSAVGRIVYRKR